MFIVTRLKKVDELRRSDIHFRTVRRRSSGAHHAFRSRGYEHLAPPEPSAVLQATCLCLQAQVAPLEVTQKRRTSRRVILHLSSKEYHVAGRLCVRILLVEDEPDSAQMLAKGLREQSYAIDIASDGDAASYQAEVNDYDLIILDLMLPRKDGLTVCRELRSRGASVPILMLTALDAVSDRITGLDAGADDYLVKPFDFHELLARVRALLRRGPALHPDRIEVGDLIIETRARMVERAGRELKLTAREYALLEYLARRHGEVVTRAEIAEHVWDESFDPFSNLIEVYIQRLRRKVDDGFVPHLIRTRRGEGYTLSARSEDTDV